MSKPITKSVREDKRKAAELRQAAYDKLPHVEKLSRAGVKQLKKLIKQEEIRVKKVS